MANMNWTDQGGYLANPELNRQYQKAAQPLLRFRQFVATKSALGKENGESVNWDKVANVGTPGGYLTETNTMHTTTQTITKGTLSVNELGNSIPYTRKLTTLSQIDIEKIIREGLLDDSVKCLDGLIEQEFATTPLYYVGTTTTTYALTTNGTATAVNTSVLNTYHFKKMIIELKKRNVPGWFGPSGKLGGDYAAIMSLEAMEGFFGSMETVNSYTETGYQKILAGEHSRYYGCRIVEDTYATRFTYDASARTSTAKSWSQGQSLDAYFFGSPTVMQGVAVREEIRAKEVTDYGRSYGLAWYALLGYEIYWDDEPNARIIKWASAS